MATVVQGSARPLKPHRTFEEQLQLLAQRGLAVGDPQAAVRTLGRLGYYRLAGYFYPLRRTNPRGVPGRQDEFEPGATLELIVSLYEFDKALRMLILDAAERLEVALRVAIAYDLGRLQPDAHMNPRYFDGRFTARRGGVRSKYDEWLDKFEERKRRAHDDFVRHHDGQYGGAMPIWVAIELWDFGLLSRFYAGMQFRLRDRLAHRLGRLTAAQLESWLRTLNFVRNVAAHHSRLWNRNVPEVPRLPGSDTHPLLAHLVHEPDRATRLYGAMSCAQFLLRQVHSDHDWSSKVKAVAAKFPATPLLDLEMAGFPVGWEALPLWA